MNSSAKIVMVGISSFQIIAMLLVSASHFTPRVLTIVKNSHEEQAPERSPAGGKRARAGVAREASRELGLEVAQRCLDLNRRDRHRLDERHPSAGESAESAERHEGESRGPAGNRVGRAELGVHQREQSEDERGDDPGNQRAATAGQQAAPRAPKSQPEPMMEPSETSVIPRNPTFR